MSKKLSALLNRPVNFLDDCIGGHVEQTIKNSNSGDVFLLENLRFTMKKLMVTCCFLKSFLVWAMLI